MVLIGMERAIQIFCNFGMSLPVLLEVAILDIRGWVSVGNSETICSIIMLISLTMKEKGRKGTEKRS